MHKYVCKRYETEEIWSQGRREWVFKNRPKTVREVLEATVRKYPNKEGFIAGKRRLTFKELDTLSDKIASALQHKFNIKKGDRIALLFGVDLEFALCFFGLTKIGAIAVPLNTRFKGEELTFEINNSESSILIMDEEFWNVVEPYQDKFQTIETIIVNSKKLPKNTLPFSALSDHKLPAWEKVELDETDTVAIMYTAGTTGHPKGAMQFNKGIIAADMLINDFLEINPDNDRILCAVPLFHSIGLTMTMIGAVYSGIPCIYMREYRTEDILRIIQDERVTMLIHVPTVPWLMVNHPNFDRYDLSSFRIAFIGGAQKSPEVIELIRKKLPKIKICEAFGMTETHTMDCLLGDQDIERKINTVGIGAPIEELKIVDEKGKECPSNTPGELLFRGSKVVREYWKNPEETKKAIVDGWLHTGDIAKIDDEGFVSILDRIKDVIIRGGENIYSVEVENVLYRHSAVLEIAVVGVPDEVMGEQVKAFIVLKEGKESSEEEIKEFCAKHLADYKVPKYVEFIDALPRNPAGKVMKKALKT